MILQQLSTYNMANDRGGLQPIPEDRNAFGVLRDSFYQARDALGCHKDDMEVRIAQMENTLATDPTATSMLRRRIENIKRAWTEFEAQYDRLRTIAGQGRLQDPVQAEQDSTYYVALQRRYLEVLARAEAALKKKLTGALKTSYRTRATHTMTQNSPESCPACGGTHTAMGSNNETYFKTRLSNCEVFTRKSVNERATIIQKARGCILCLN